MAKRRLGEVDVDELTLYIDNTGELYPQRQRIRTQLIKHACGGLFSKTQAAKAFERLTDAGRKRYQREIGPTVTPFVAKRVAQEYVKEFMRDFNLCARGTVCDFTNDQIKLIRSDRCRRPNLSGSRRRRRR